MQDIQKIRKDRRRNKIKINNKNNLPIVYIYRSSKYIYGQCIQDGNVICCSNTMKYGHNDRINNAEKAGVDLGNQLLKHNIKKIIFDFNCYEITGRVDAFKNGVLNVINKENDGR